MEFKTISILTDDHTALVGIAAKNNRMKLYAMISALVRGWPMLTPEQQHAAMRGDAVPTRLPCSERTPSITRLCNQIQRGSLDLDAIVDDLAADGEFSDDDKAKARPFVKALFDRICEASAHLSTPEAVPA